MPGEEGGGIKAFKDTEASRLFQGASAMERPLTNKRIREIQSESRCFRHQPLPTLHKRAECIEQTAKYQRQLSAREGVIGKYTVNIRCYL